MTAMDSPGSPRSATGPEDVAARTYLFALTDAGGTVPPELGVVRRLVERGHRVTVLADESMADQSGAPAQRMNARAGRARASSATGS